MKKQEYTELQRQYSNMGISFHKKTNGLFILGRFNPKGGAIYQTFKTYDQELVKDINNVIAGFDSMAVE